MGRTNETNATKIGWADSTNQFNAIHCWLVDKVCATNSNGVGCVGGTNATNAASAGWLVEPSILHSGSEGLGVFLK